MTELIRDQLGAMGLMVCSGMTAGIVYEFFFRMQNALKRLHLPRIFGWSLEITGLLLIGWCSSVFLYYSSGGKITMQGVTCFFIGLLIWRKLIYTKDGVKEYGEKGNQTAGIREESQSAGYYRRTGGTKKEKEEKNKKRKKHHRGPFHRI